MKEINEITKKYLKDVANYDERLNELKTKKNEASEKLKLLEVKLTNATLDGNENTDEVRDNIHKLNNDVNQYNKELEILEGNRDDHVQQLANEALRKAKKHHEKIKDIKPRIIHNIEKTRTKLLDLLVEYQKDKERRIQELFSIKQLVGLADPETVRELGLSFYEDKRAEHINTVGIEYEITHHDMMSHYIESKGDK